MKTCLLILLLLAPLAQQSATAVKGDSRTTGEKVPTVSLCSLYAKPKEYDGKRVRVRAEYHLGFEYSYLDDTSCKEFAIKSTPFRIGNAVWAEFDESELKSSTDAEVYKKFREQANACCPDGWRDTRVDVVVTGKFSLSAGGDGDGFGHMGGYALQLSLDRVEEVGEPHARP